MFAASHDGRPPAILPRFRWERNESAPLPCADNTLLGQLRLRVELKFTLEFAVVIGITRGLELTDNTLGLVALCAWTAVRLARDLMSHREKAKVLDLSATYDEKVGLLRAITGRRSPAAPSPTRGQEETSDLGTDPVE